MRMHIEVDDDLVQQVDAVAGERGRSRFVREAIVAALEQRRRAALIRSAKGAISDTGHEWDSDPGGWVHRERHSQRRRVG